MKPEQALDTPNRTPIEGWRSLLLLSGYRWLLVLFLSAIPIAGSSPHYLGDDVILPLFALVCLLYLLLCVPTTLAVLIRRPGLTWQIYLHAAVDVSMLLTLVYASGGVQSGLGMLLITPVAGTSILLPRRMAILLGAIASLGLLGEEAYRQLQLGMDTAHFIQAGLLGLVFFFAALVANSLSLRARTSEALAAKSKAALANLSQINEKIIQNMQIGVLVVDAQQDIRLLNQAACSLLNTRLSAINKPLAGEAPELAGHMREWLGNSYRDNEPFTIDTSDRNLLVHFSRLASEADAPVLVFLEDAGRLGEQAQQMKLASLGQLTASIAHEIRNPLGAISHASQLLSESISGQPQERRLLEIIHRHTGRINTIIEDILELSRRGNAAPEILRLRPWLEQLIHEYQESHPKGAPRLEYELVSPAAEIRADPGHLRQIFNNLWDNALEHSGLPYDQLVIQHTADIWPESGRVYLEISDNGKGIPPEIAAQIFVPFFTTTRQGTGLGLYIVRELCECNHAKLSVQPSETSGARFRIIFANPADWLAQESMSTTQASLASHS